MNEWLWIVVADGWGLGVGMLLPYRTLLEIQECFN